MNKKTVAILSTKENFKDFMALEAECRGYTPLVGEKWSDVSGEDGDICLLLYDIDSVDVIDENRSFPSVGFTSKRVKDRERNGLYRLPASMEALDRIFSYAEKGDEAERSIRDGREIVVLEKDGERRYFFCGSLLRLSGHEQVILHALCEAEGMAVSRDALNAMLGTDKGNIADVYVCKLRKKLEGICGRKVILTARGEGYRTELVIAEVQ